MAEADADVSAWITGEWGPPEEVRYNARDLILYSVGKSLYESDRPIHIQLL